MTKPKIEELPTEYNGIKVIPDGPPIPPGYYDILVIYSDEILHIGMIMNGPYEGRIIRNIMGLDYDSNISYRRH